MIDFVKKSKEKVSVILAYSLKRFSRIGDNAIWLSRQLRESGVTIKSATQPMDTSNPSGVLQQYFVTFSIFAVWSMQISVQNSTVRHDGARVDHYKGGFLCVIKDDKKRKSGPM